MERDGWLERRPDPKDRRARRLYLTKKTKPLLDEIWRLAGLTLAEAFAGISNTERSAFIRMLERVHRNVCALEGAPGDDADSTPVRERPRPKPKTPAHRPPSRVQA
jgi:hypothetical protein